MNNKVESMCKESVVAYCNCYRNICPEKRKESAENP
jgi:hypothetical protein